MIDSVQLLVCACDSANVIATWGDYFEIPTTYLGTVAFLVEGTKGHKSVPNRWHVQSTFEAKLSLPLSVWDLDSQYSGANCRKPLLVGHVEEH